MNKVIEKKIFEQSKESKVKVYKSLQDFLEEMKNKKEQENQENVVDLGRRSRIDETVLDEIREKCREECLIDFDEVNNHFGKKFGDLCEEIKSHSPYKRFKTYRVKLLLLRLVLSSLRQMMIYGKS